MEKRGQIVYKALVVIIGGALIIAGFIEGGKSYGSQEAFYKLAVAKDIALTIDLLYALPGDIGFIYPNDVSGYDIKIKNNRVLVYNTGSELQDRNLQLYTFAGSDKDVLDFYIKNPKFVKFEKSNDKIIVKGVSK